MAFNDLWLKPPLIEKGKLNAFHAQNSTVSAILSARGNSLAVFPTADLLPFPQSSKQPRKSANTLYLVKWDRVPDFRRKFITITSSTFDMLRHDIEEFRKKDQFKKPSRRILAQLNTRATLYITAIQDQLELYEKKLRTEPNEEVAVEQAVLEIAYTSLLLTQTIWMPWDGIQDTPVGLELMHWLNRSFMIETEPEGKQYLEYLTPWDAPGFWTFLKSCLIRRIFRPVTYFLSSLSQKTARIATREVAEQIIRAVSEMPIYTDYPDPALFFEQHRKWKTSLHLLNRAVEKHRGSAYEGKVDLEEIVSLIDGKDEALYQICKSCNLSWRDAICAWGTWINPRFTRLDIAAVTKEVIEALPTDPTSQEDKLLSALFTGDVVKAASVANDIDAWLACHLSDLLECLVIPGVAPVVANLRNHLVTVYAEHLLSDPSMWRLAVSYLTHCGEVGMNTAGEILLHLPFRISGVNVETEVESRSLAMFAGTGDPVAPVAELDDIIDACEVYGLKEVKQAICRVAAQKLTDLRMYGKAVEYAAQTWDRTAVRRIVGKLESEYLLNGPEEFVHFVDQIPGQYLYPAPNLHDDASLFCARLHFVVTYAEFHYAVSQNEQPTAKTISHLVSLFNSQGLMAPEPWWGLLLADIGDLLADDDILIPSEDMNLILARLEDVSLRTRYGAGKDYLWALMRRYSMKTENEALQRLERVRFTLIHAAARSMLSRVGGKGPLESAG